MDCCYLNAIVSSIRTHISNVTEVIDAMQSANGKFFAADLANRSCSVPFQQPPSPEVFPTSKGTQCTFIRLHMDTSSLLTVFSGEILTVSTLLQEHSYDITLVTSSSNEIHLTLIQDIQIK